MILRYLANVSLLCACLCFAANNYGELQLLGDQVLQSVSGQDGLVISGNLSIGEGQGGQGASVAFQSANPDEENFIVFQGIQGNIEFTGIEVDAQVVTDTNNRTESVLTITLPERVTFSDNSGDEAAGFSLGEQVVSDSALQRLATDVPIADRQINGAFEVRGQLHLFPSSVNP